MEGVRKWQKHTLVRQTSAERNLQKSSDIKASHCHWNSGLSRQRQQRTKAVKAVRGTRIFCIHKNTVLSIGPSYSHSVENGLQATSPLMRCKVTALNRSQQGPARMAAMKSALAAGGKSLLAVLRGGRVRRPCKGWEGVGQCAPRNKWVSCHLISISNTRSVATAQHCFSKSVHCSPSPGKRLSQSCSVQLLLTPMQHCTASGVRQSQALSSAEPRPPWAPTCFIWDHYSKYQPHPAQLFWGAQPSYFLLGTLTWISLSISLNHKVSPLKCF